MLVVAEGGWLSKVCDLEPHQVLGPSLSQHLADEEIPARLKALTLGLGGHSRHPSPGGDEGWEDSKGISEGKRQRLSRGASWNYPDVRRLTRCHPQLHLHCTEV